MRYLSVETHMVMATMATSSEMVVRSCSVRHFETSMNFCLQLTFDQCHVQTTCYFNAHAQHPCTLQMNFLHTILVIKQVHYKVWDL